MDYIFTDEPSDWRDLQEKCKNILEGAGYVNADIEKNLSTVRGVVNVDVYAEKNREILICECKNWKRPVSKNTIHSFRIVVQDFGATHGYIISKAGFQSGALQAAKNTNVFLVDWWQFQTLFLYDWIVNMGEIAYRATDKIFKYTDVLVPKKFLENLTKSEQEEYWDMYNHYQQIWSMASSLHLPLMSTWLNKEAKISRIKNTFSDKNINVIDPVTHNRVSLNSYSELLNFILKHAIEGPERFEKLINKNFN